jgi:hypothetical protein
MASVARLETDNLSTFADKATADALIAKMIELRPLFMAEAAAGEQRPQCIIAQAAGRGRPLLH